MSFCYLDCILKETQCYIRGKQVKTEIPLSADTTSAVAAWFTISTVFKGE